MYIYGSVQAGTSFVTGVDRDPVFVFLRGTGGELVAGTFFACRKIGSFEEAALLSLWGLSFSSHGDDQEMQVYCFRILWSVCYCGWLLR